MIEKSEFYIVGTVLEVDKLDDGLVDDRLDIIIGDEGSYKNRIEISLYGDLAREAKKNLIKNTQIAVKGRLNSCEGSSFFLVGTKITYLDIKYCEGRC